MAAMATDPQDEEIIVIPLAGTRGQAVQRLQIGLAGLTAMVLIVGLANIILDRVKQTDASSVPEAAASLAPKCRSRGVPSRGRRPKAATIRSRRRASK